MLLHLIANILQPFKNFFQTLIKLLAHKMFAFTETLHLLANILRSLKNLFVYFPLRNFKTRNFVYTYES